MGIIASPDLDPRLAPGASNASDRPAPRLAKPRLGRAYAAGASCLPRPVYQSPFVRAAVIALLGALLTGAVVNWSLRHGRLILPPAYDDCTYIEDAAHALRVVCDRGVGTYLGDYAMHPPHSPYGTGVGLLAFLVFGVHDWAPYVTSVVLVCGYLAVSDRLLRGLPLWQKVIVFGFVLSVPLVARSVEEFRPDHASALFLCGGLILLLQGPLLRSSLRHKAVCGALIGLAVLAKPPMFIAAGLLTGWALVLATTADFLGAGRLAPGRRPTASQVAAAWAAVLLPAVLVPLPHFAVATRQVVGYIYDNMFGRYKNVWQTRGTLAWHLNYYLCGEGGQIMLGRTVRTKVFVLPRHLGLIGIVLATGVVQVLWRRRRAELVRAAALALMLLASFAIPAVTKNKTQFFGLGFHTFLLFLAVLTLGHLLLASREWRLPVGWTGSSPAARRWPQWAVATALVLFSGYGVASFSWPTRVGDAAADWIVNRRQIVEGVYAACLNASRSHSDPRVFVTCEGDVNRSVLNFLSCRETDPLEFYETKYPYDADPGPTIAEFDRADMVVAGETGSGLIADFLPNYANQDKYLAELRSRPDFKQTAHFVYAPTGKGFYLFERAGSFVGWTSADNLGEIEGPAEVTNFKRVRWGYGPATTLKLEAPTTGNYALTVVGRGWGGEVMTVKLDGREVGKAPVPDAKWGRFNKRVVRFPMSAGPHELRLEYSIWTHGNDRPMAILFEELRVLPTKE